MSLTRPERETVICANLADLDQGFFTIHTTEPGVLARLKRLAGARLVIKELAHTGAKKRPVAWEITVPADLWRGSSLRIARKRTATPSQKAQLTSIRPVVGPDSDPNP